MPYKATSRRVPDPFLGTLGLPGAWAARRQFALLDIAPPSWHNFLSTWQAWRADPASAALLHYVAVGPVLTPPTTLLTFAPDLATELQAALWGLLPGFHRVSLDDGRVLLTVCMGDDVQAMLRDQAFEADALFVNASASIDMANVHTVKAMARCCRRGTRVAGVGACNVKALTQCGFEVTPTSAGWQGQFNPAWTARRKTAHPGSTPSTDALPAQVSGRCLVIGGGLAGTSVAASLARRGWHVTVLDAAEAVASGASSLPAGIVAPHVSPDDSPLSRLSRAGIRMTIQQARSLLLVDQDWSLTGVLERCLAHPRHRPAAWHAGGADAAPAADWVTPASAEQLAACQLVESDGEALWHAKAGWIKPAELARAWLTTPNVTWRGRSDVASLQRHGHGWQALDRAGTVLASGVRVVLAAGHATAALAQGHRPQALPLQPIRGQVSWNIQTGLLFGQRPLPPFPVNGHGHLLAGISLGVNSAKQAWLIGASYERDVAAATLRPEDNAHNLRRLHELLPNMAAQLNVDASALHAWSGVRGATPTRLPWVGPLSADGVDNGLWVCTGMGSRGLTFAALCAELLAAQWHGEPWPIEQRLGAAMTP